MTILLGTIFLADTGMEWYKLIVHDHLTIHTNLFGTTFYSLVGLHASHVVDWAADDAGDGDVRVDRHICARSMRSGSRCSRCTGTLWMRCGSWCLRWCTWWGDDGISIAMRSAGAARRDAQRTQCICRRRRRGRF